MKKNEIGDGCAADRLPYWLGIFLHSLEKAGYMNDLKEKWFAHPIWLPQMK